MDMMSTNSTPHAIHQNGANQAGSFFALMKQPLSFDDQIRLMKSRGLVVNDERTTLERLTESNYYRLRGYWLTFEKNGRFLPGTTFDMIWNIYDLDNDLRNWMWRCIAPIEIKARTLFAYHIAMEHGAVSHEDSRLFKSTISHDRSMKSLARERNRALKDGVPCVVHNIERYGDLPIWAAVEIMSMGTVSQLYGNLNPRRTNVAKLVAKGFGIKPFILKSWLRHLTYIRNICGHHSRLYNRVMTTRATMLKMDAPYDGDKEFPTLIVLKRIFERSWPKRWLGLVDGLEGIVERHPSVPLAPMGFPDNWFDVLDHV